MFCLKQILCGKLWIKILKNQILCPYITNTGGVTLEWRLGRGCKIRHWLLFPPYFHQNNREGTNKPAYLFWLCPRYYHWLYSSFSHNRFIQQSMTPLDWTAVMGCTGLFDGVDNPEMEICGKVPWGGTNHCNYEWQNNGEKLEENEV